MNKKLKCKLVLTSTHFIMFRSDKEGRAIELCKLMPDLELVQSAIRFATQKRK